MDKFKINQVRDYFIRTNKEGASFRDLSTEDLISLSVMSLFDKKGQTIKTSSYEYVKPDGVIDEQELNITKSDYDKMVKDIQKELKREKGTEISAMKIPSYDDLLAMMRDDKKIDFMELHDFACKDLRKNVKEEAPQPIKIPEKTKSNELTLAQKEEFVKNVLLDPVKEAALTRVEERLDNETLGHKAFDFKKLDAELANVQKELEAFTPDDNVAYNMQVGADISQFNSNGQRVGRVNNTANCYEKFSYDSNDKDAKYTQMVRYNENGYKTDYFRRMTLVDKNGNSFEGVVIYHLDENEKITKITYPENAKVPQDVQDFNDYKLYERVNNYYNDLSNNGAFEE